jgi:SAM-dependent methyltransferase
LTQRPGFTTLFRQDRIVPNVKCSKSHGTVVFAVFLFLGSFLFPVPGPSSASTTIPELRQGQLIFRGDDGVILDVPYVPTEDFVVDQMLNLVELRAGDILYDLGCGDGRIVVGAARKADIRGTGIDIDPARIAESKAKAIAAGVAARTTFLQQDLFQSDIGGATVVTLFLLREINMKLRPKLFRELKPGTRVVSHNFDMGDWPPDISSFLGLWEDGFHTLYSWVVPANASGSWTGQHGGESLRLIINQKFQNVTGSLLIDKKTVLPLSEAKISGRHISFTAKNEEQGRSIIFEGAVTGNVLEGMLNEKDTKGEPWKAVRDPDTISWIE